jgi:hypothetical protein
MTEQFNVGDHVRWNSEAGHVSGTIIKVHTTDSEYMGYTHHASKDDPQYETKSDKTDHIAVHKGLRLQRSVKATAHSRSGPRTRRKNEAQRERLCGRGSLGEDCLPVCTVRPHE